MKERGENHEKQTCKNDGFTDSNNNGRCRCDGMCGSDSSDASADANTDTTASDTTANADTTDGADLSGTVTLAGSTSMEKLANAMNEAFMEKYPNVSATAGFTGSVQESSLLQPAALISEMLPVPFRR